MEQLIEQLKTNAGLNEEQAQKAIETVVGFIKSKLPVMMHAAVDGFITSAPAHDDQDPLG